MAQQNSFDITTGVDLQEVDNAINQAQKEIAQRYDFKDSKATIDFQRGEGKILLTADSEFRMCQWGAIGRARAGQDFRTILRTYFPGTTVARVY